MTRSTIWQGYPIEARNQYIDFLKAYASLTRLFNQKNSSVDTPYIDSKFQETIYAKVFSARNVDSANTPHDILSVVNGRRVGVGLKTWMGSGASWQKVMQLKAFKNEIEDLKFRPLELIQMLSNIRNERLLADYNRLDLGHHGNIYHFITRHDGLLSLYECPYRMINVEAVQLIGSGGSKSIQWTDGSKKFKLTFGDSQIHQWFDPQANDTNFLGSFEAPILDDPFAALLRLKGHESEPLRNVVPDESVASSREDIAYLPLYSFRSKQVEEKSGLNAWNAAPKSGDSPRPLNEIYVPIPREFHLQHPDFFTPDINAVLERKKNGERVGDIRFHVKLPNDKIIPCSITQSNFKAFQSGSQTELDESNKRYGQAALGQWLLIDVLGLKERKLVTKDWLNKKGIDSIRLRRVRSDFFELDIAPTHSFETFMAVDTDLSDSD